MVRCFFCTLDFGQSNNTFYEVSAFFKHGILLSSPVENQLAPVNAFFLCFPAEIFDFSFNPQCKIGWPPGHLDRVFLLKF